MLKTEFAISYMVWLNQTFKLALIVTNFPGQERQVFYQPNIYMTYNSKDSDIIKHKQTFFTSVDRRSVKERTVMPLIPLE